MRSFYSLLAVCAALVGGLVTLTQPAAADHGCSLMRGIDTNHDGRLDIFEVKRAASRTFKRLNDDGDLTLERDELYGRMGPRAYAAANRIKGKGIDRIEYKRYVKKLFKRINRDGDRTLECPELCTRAGMRLLRLIK